MPVANKIIKNSYYDSVFLMRIAQKISGEPQVDEAAAMMGTVPNKEILERAGILAGNGREAGPNDLVVAVKAETEEIIKQTFSSLETLLSGQDEDDSTEEFNPRTLTSALERLPQANLLLLSIPGEYVRREASKALDAGLHVMIFSDNVPLKDELYLKNKAKQGNQLVMGPDCGTVLLKGKALGFGNVVRCGSIGIVAASGTGIQEVATLIHKLGAGVSHAIGVGGHDLSREVGALSFTTGLSYLENDPETTVIVLISKPPAPEVAQSVLERARSIAKPMVVCFLGSREKRKNQDDMSFVSTLEDTARAAVSMVSGTIPFMVGGTAPGKPQEFETGQQLRPEQRFIRGLFSGGTLCEEALNVLEPLLDGPVFTNLKPRREIKSLTDPWNSLEHSFVDLGEDLFTRGRPHPMIDFNLRCKRILQEAADPVTAIILLDVVLGYGSHPDPASELVPVIKEARKQAHERGTDIIFVASICGTDDDPQVAAGQSESLADAGVLMADCNAEAARLAARVLDAQKSSSQPQEQLEKTIPRTESRPGVAIPGTQSKNDRSASADKSEIEILNNGVCMVNMGLKSFHESMKDQESQSIHVDWRPPAGGNKELTDLLDRML